MEKVDLLSVLNTVFKDIASINTIIEDSKTVEQSCNEVNIQNHEEVQKLIEATKNIVKSLENATTKVSQCFNENYNLWKDDILEVTSKLTQNGLSENGIEAEMDSTITSELDQTSNIESLNEGTENSSKKLNENVSEICNTPNNGDIPLKDNVKSVIKNDSPTDKTAEDSCGASNVVGDVSSSLTVLKENNDTINENTATVDQNVSDTLKEHNEPKIFLKCVDIKKLVKPDILTKLNSSAKNDSILIISDSDEEFIKTNPNKNKTRKMKSVKPRNNKIKHSECITTSNINNTYSSSSDMEIKSARTLRKMSNKTKKKWDVIESLSDTGSTSSSSLSLLNNSPKKSKIKQNANKTIKPIEITKFDKKFSYKTFVPLPRIPCEKLLEYYLKKKEISKIKSLTNMNSLNKRGRTIRSSSDSDSKRPQSKRRKQASKKNISLSNRSISISSESSEEGVMVLSNSPHVDDTLKPDSDLGNDAIKILLNNVQSDSNHSADEGDIGNSSEDEKKKQAEGKDKKSVDNKDKENSEKKERKDEEDSKGIKPLDEQCNSDSESQEKNSKKNNWRKDSLLREKLSESESEDEFVTFKKNKEKAKGTVKNRMTKSRRNFLGSDSDTENEKKQDNKDNNKQKTSSSSESDSDHNDHKETSEPEDTSPNKKRRRIKRVDDSSEDDEKTTRKNIRKVIAHESLAETTKQAEKDEKERKMRIAERQKKYNQMFDTDKLADATIDKVVLDFNKDTHEELLSVPKKLVKKLKPHQAKGVQFMWDACFESLARAESTNGSGCILAHCMGLGKTLQVITLVYTLLINEKKTGVKSVLVICPVNTGLNWVDEFDKWLEDMEESTIYVYDLVSVKQNSERQYRVKEWTKNGGVLVMGYDMYRNLTNPDNKRLKKSQRDIFQKGLVDPGPSLVVCDEGHLLKNEKTNLSIAVNRIHSKRRIILTGTPMQNNMKEYYCMVQFVKPNLLGTYKEYINRFVNPITNGQYTDSTPHDINIMRKRSHVLHKMLDGVVQRKDYSVLMPYLPPKHEYVMFIKLSEIQISLYKYYMDNLSRQPTVGRVSSYLFTDFQDFQKICTHPRALLMKSLEQRKKNMFDDDEEEEEDSEGSLKDFIDDESEESTAESTNSSGSGSSAKSSKKNNSKPHTSRQRLTRNSAAAAGIDVLEETEKLNQPEENEWWRRFCNGEELDNIAHSGKLYLLFEILQQCELIGDKILVFSQSLYSLDLIEYFLARIDEASQNDSNKETVCGFSGSWALGLDYFRIDGSSSCDNRAAWCKNFNNPDNIRGRLFLISTRAGGLGINLIGANRVIIFDVSWNPSHDVQSIYRIYRFGQIKPCYIYRFVTLGTMEMKIYERQVTKQAISKRIIDEKQIDRHYNQNDLAELYKFDPSPVEQEIPLVPKDILLAELLQNEKDRIYKYHEHQSLLENKEDEELNEEERKAAWEEFENEKVARVAAPSGAGLIRNIPVSTIAAAIYSIIKKDNPTWSDEQIQSVVPIVIQQLREQVESGNNVLMTRVSTELQLLHIQQQQKIREYYMQQHQKQMELYQRQQLANLLTPAAKKTNNQKNAAKSSTNVIEINDNEF